MKKNIGDQLKQQLYKKNKSLYDISNESNMSLKQLLKILNTRNFDKEILEFYCQKLKISLDESTSINNSYNQYTCEFINEIIELCNSVSIQTICKTYKIPKSTLYRWKNKINFIQEK